MEVSEVPIYYFYVLRENPMEIVQTEVLDDLVLALYEGKADFISEGQRLELKLSSDYLDNLRRIISSYEERVPLYDIRSNQIFLIHWQNVYNNIYRNNYRFIDQNFYEDLTRLENPNTNDLINRKFLSYYHLPTLKRTYLNIFYESFVVSSYITNCMRPSFSSGLDHISPYYNIDELNYLASDWGLIDKITIDQSDLRRICGQIQSYDISAKTLLDHQLYIYQSKAIGLVKYYSLYGSYYMNLYLRKSRCCLIETTDYSETIRNLYLENQIKIMIDLIRKAPPFEKSHTVYRFIERDDYLSHLKIGDVWTDPSFMSTTRNPFYYKENYTFGYILIKIKIPSNQKGVGLCIESYSNFPNEEEIIFNPTSRYRLDNVTDATTDFHLAFDLKVQRRYEFTFIGNDYYDSKKKIILDLPGAYVPKLESVDLINLLSDENIRYLTVTDRLKYFRDSYTNQNNQFQSKIGSNTYTFSFSAYDSSSVYKPFFYYETSNGIMITTANPRYGNINLLLELSTEIHVNYYFRYSVTDPSDVVNLDREEWIQWLALLAYVVGSRTVVLHSNYTLETNESDTTSEKIMKTRYTFSQNIYSYMKNGKRYYQYVEVVPQFDYYYLDYLKTVSIDQIALPTDKDELYKIAKNSGLENVYDLYLYIVENYPKLIRNLENKMDRIFEPNQNPFLNLMYSLDAWQYLYNRNLINTIPDEKEFQIRKGSFKKLIGDKKIPKFKNRLRRYISTVL